MPDTGDSDKHEMQIVALSTGARRLFATRGNERQGVALAMLRTLCEVLDEDVIRKHIKDEMHDDSLGCCALDPQYWQKRTACRRQRLDFLHAVLDVKAASAELEVQARNAAAEVEADEAAAAEVEAAVEADELHPLRQTLNPKPKTQNPKPKTQNP